MDGAVSWTEMGQERGLDPLAMLNVIETRYQSLLPGFSSVTTRLRNYSFYAWIIAHYADNIHEGSLKRFRAHLRRCEALYALASAQDPKEIGVAARLFANEQLRTAGSEIDFTRATAPETPPAERYMDPEAGVFTGVYFRQMVDFGLLDDRTKHGLPVPTETGMKLAAAYGESMGALATTFFRAAKEGRILRSDLAPLVIMRPSALDQLGEEARLLRDLLLGSDGRDMSLERRKTLTLILETSQELAKPVSVDDLRWSWLERPSSTAQDPTLAAWRHYQTGDTVRVIYEALLRHATKELSNHVAGLPPAALSALVLQDVPQMPLSAYFEELEAAQAGSSFQDLQAAALREDASISEILVPLARLCEIWRHNLDELRQSYPDQQGYQTALSELRWLVESGDEMATSVLRTLLSEHVLRRHLEVAARKFHLQRRYTYLVEIEEARIRARRVAQVEASGPRLATALQFLADVGLLDEGRITPRGLEVMEAK